MISAQLTIYFILLILLLSTIVALKFINSSDNRYQLAGDPNFTMPLLLSLFFTYWLGHRQIFLGGYVDTANYAREYINMNVDHISTDFSGEWIWTLLMQTCKYFDLSATDFFTVVEAGYLLPMLWAMHKFLPSNTYLGMLFVWGSLFFLPFGVNGIRNGLACNVLFLAIAFLFEGKYTIGFVMAIICFGIHRSTILPIMTCVFAIFLYRDVKWCIAWWVASIFLSLFMGGWFTNFFAGLGFDDRMSQYIAEQDMSMFSQSGFRWDFLLYSSFPVIMAWYVCVKEEVTDNWYNAICTIYILANSFWVLVIRAAYSNRFAYLSWFIYPLVIAYPLIVLPVWHDQDIKTGMILVAYVLFTLLMNFMWGATSFQALFY